MSATTERRLKEVEARFRWREWQQFHLYHVPEEGKDAARWALRELQPGERVLALKAILAVLPMETREPFKASLRACLEAFRAQQLEEFP